MNELLEKNLCSYVREMVKKIQENPDVEHFIVSPLFQIQLRALNTKEAVIKSIKDLCNRWLEETDPEGKTKIETHLKNLTYWLGKFE